jgi:hypothetical protein
LKLDLVELDKVSERLEGQTVEVIPFWENLRIPIDAVTDFQQGFGIRAGEDDKRIVAAILGISLARALGLNTRERIHPNYEVNNALIHLDRLAANCDGVVCVKVHVVVAHRIVSFSRQRRSIERQ